MYCEMPSNFGGLFLEEIRRKFDDKIALIWRENPITFGQFREDVLRWSSFIEDLKSRTSEPLRIALFLTNSPEILEIVLASQISGVTVIPLNPSYKKYEIQQYLSQSHANFVIANDDVNLDYFENIEVRKISDLQSSLPWFIESPTPEYSEGSIVFFSSGTTGPPKLFTYTQRILCSQIDQIREIQSDPRFFSPSDWDLCYGVLPFFHAGGLMTILSMLFSGCTVLINERWNDLEFLGNCQKFKVSVLFLVPPVLKFLASHPVVSSFDLSSLKTVYVGAAASAPEDFERVSRRLPGLENLIQIYGTTECGVLLCSTGKGIATGTTVGIPYPLVHINIDPETREILVKSKTAVEEDFMQTGDLGIFEDGKLELRITGRLKEMMKIRGWQVNPNEIEDVIRKIEGVQDCAVFQVKNSDRLIAKVIFQSPNPNEADIKKRIISIVEENLASYKQLHDVIFVSDLPRNPSGKLVRHLLQ